MEKYSNVVNHNSPDDLPANPYPAKAIRTTCVNEDCMERISEEVCPFCGTENKIEYEPDYEAGQSED